MCRVAEDELWDGVDGDVDGSVAVWTFPVEVGGVVVALEGSVDVVVLYLGLAVGAFHGLLGLGRRVVNIPVGVR